MPEGLTDAQIIQRLERLEAAVRKIARHTGTEIDDPAAGIDPDIAELARSGERMQAAKLLSERTGVSFIDAQRTVNAL